MTASYCRNVLAFYYDLLHFNMTLPAPLDHSTVSEEGVGILRQTKDLVAEDIDQSMIFMFWFSTLESLLAQKPEPSPAPRPAAFLHLWCHLLAQGGAHCCPGLQVGGALWSAFQCLLGLWAVELRCRNGSEVWRRIEPSLADARHAAHYATELMGQLWEGTEFMPAAWVLTEAGKDCAHAVPSLAVMGRSGTTPPTLVYGVCAYQALVTAGLDHLTSAV